MKSSRSPRVVDSTLRLNLLKRYKLRPASETSHLLVKVRRCRKPACSFRCLSSGVLARHQKYHSDPSLAKRRLEQVSSRKREIVGCQESFTEPTKTESSAEIIKRCPHLAAHFAIFKAKRQRLLESGSRTKSDIKAYTQDVESELEARQTDLVKEAQATSDHQLKMVALDFEVNQELDKNLDIYSKVAQKFLDRTGEMSQVDPEFIRTKFYSVQEKVEDAINTGFELRPLAFEKESSDQLITKIKKAGRVVVS